MFYKKTLRGKDYNGNSYYTKGEKRFVLYGKKHVNPTLIPPEWHLWLHHASDHIPVLFLDFSQPKDENIGYHIEY